MNKFTIQDLSNEEADELMEKLNGQRFIILHSWMLIYFNNVGYWY